MKKVLTSFLLIVIVLAMRFLLIVMVFTMLLSIAKIQPVKATGTEQIVNGGFETGGFTGWDVYGNTATVSTTHPYTGNYSAKFVYVSSNPTISQLFTPIDLVNITSFGFWYRADISNMNPNIHLYIYYNGGWSSTGWGSPYPCPTVYTYVNCLDWISGGALGVGAIEIWCSGITSSDIWYIDDVSLIAPPFLVTVNIVKPENVTYTSSTIPIEITASDGTVDEIWYNCKNDTSWIYGLNQTYMTATVMSDFINGTSYTFYAWANNTDGNSDEETVMFTVAIPISPTELPFTLPMMFIFGIIGLCCMFAGPMYGIYKVKKEEYYTGFRIGLIVTCLGAALVVAWLWGGVPNL